MSRHTPTIIELPSAVASEAAKAKFWRINIAKLSRTELSRAIAYSVPAIQAFERGYNSNGQPIGSSARKRYRLACASLTNAGANFNWDDKNVWQPAPAQTSQPARSDP